MNDFMYTLCKMFTPKYQVSPRVYKLLEEISRIREQLRVSLVKVPWVPSLVRDAMARSAWGSTAIEGCTLSLEAVRGLMEGKRAIGYPDRHIRMAKNYLNALAWLEKKGKQQLLHEKEILALHRIISEGAVDEGPVGDYRKVNVRAGLHVGTPWQNVPDEIRKLIKWINSDAKDLPAVFSSAILHLRFVEIHPFRDGNGRVARALATWQLYRMGFDTLHIFALDEVLLENRSLYIKALQRVQVEKKDMGGWIEFIAETVIETLGRVQKRVQAIGISGESAIALTLRQEKLLNILRERGALGIREISQTLRVTSPGAHYALKPLLKQKLIKIIGAHKNTRYILG